MATTTLPRGHIQRIAIIGAGPSGLAAAKYLLAERAFTHIAIYEQRAVPGGVWAATPDLAGADYAVPQTAPAADAAAGDFQSPVYDALETNIPTGLMGFAGAPWAATTQLFPRHEAVREYLEGYAEEVRGLVSFGTQVVDDVTTRNLLTGTETTAPFDAVLVANGHYDRAYIPAIPGLAAFHAAHPRAISHSKAYRRPAPFAGLKVLVVGAGISGSDIAAHLAPHARAPLLLSSRAAAPSSPDAPPPPPATPGITPVPEIASFDPRDRSVRFVDGSREADIDRVIFWTGYLFSYPFLRALSPPVVSDGARTQALWQHLFYHPAPTLAFLTLPSRVVPAAVAEAQSAVVARFLAGRLALPARAAREAWEVARVREVGAGRAFHVLGFPADAAYIAELCGMANGADGVGGKRARAFGARERWLRERMGEIVLAFRGLGEAERARVRGVEELGFVFPGDACGAAHEQRN